MGRYLGGCKGFGEANDHNRPKEKTWTQKLFIAQVHK